MAGISSSDFEVIGDPQDLYLVKTDTWGRTNGCEAPWNPSVVAPNLAVVCKLPAQPPVLVDRAVFTPVVFGHTGFVRAQCVGP